MGSRLKLVVVLAMLAVSILVTAGIPESSQAHSSLDHYKFGSAGNHNGSMLDSSAMMVCGGVANNSMTHAATQWDATAFGPNGYVPWYNWSPNCNLLNPNSYAVRWWDYNLPDGLFAYAESWGIRISGTYGKCGTGSNYCNPYATLVNIYMNDWYLNSGDVFTQSVARHELGHPPGLGDGTGSCNLNDPGIMTYDCVRWHNQTNVGPHDVSDINALY